MKLVRIIIVLTLSLFGLKFCICSFHAENPYLNPTNKYIKAGTDLDRIQKLINRGEDVDTRDRRTGLTALHVLANFMNRHSIRNYNSKKQMIDYYKTAELLLNNGANVNVTDWDGQTVLRYCGIDIECVKFFLKYGVDVNIGLPIYHPVCMDTLDLVKLYVANDADVNVRDPKKTTPLFCCKSREMAKLLINNGADVNVRDSEGRTPLFSSSNNDAAIELMIKNGADVHAKNIKGETALFQPFLEIERVKLFVKYKININEQDNTGKTVLHHILSEDVPY
ncbi:MAG: ankyrin repeat domain-containing protein, partial [Leptospirales bacterium]|nr:ankyrin repeat domain-containing protein [Leptospirales bacterium]